MSILDAELLVYKSVEVSDAGTNGGRMSANQAVSSVVNNVWPNALKAERLAGSTKYRKVFSKVANDDDYTLYNPQLWLDKITSADDWVMFFAATLRNTQADIVGTEDKYGCALLYADVSAGASSIVVQVEDSSLQSGNDVIFRVGDKVRLTDKAAIGGAGNEEELIIDTGGVTPGASNTITLDFTTNLLYSYTVVGGSKAMSILEPSDIECSIDNWVETSTSGTYDETTYPIVPDNIGTIEETWTLTFSSPTNFEVVGDTVGSVGTGTIAGDFAPDNTDFTKPYFTLDKDGWGGSWLAAETVVFQTHPAAVPVFEKRVIPAASSSLAGNSTTLVFSGESE